MTANENLIFISPVIKLKKVLYKLQKTSCICFFMKDDFISSNKFSILKH